MRITADNIEIKIVTKVDHQATVRLYREANWWSDSFGTGFIDDMVAGSFCVAGAFENDSMIGMGRALSDGVSDAYIQDVTVLKSYRSCEIGTKIIEKLVEELQANGVDWIGLIGEPGTQAFYERMGFATMQNYIPMLLQHK